MKTFNEYLKDIPLYSGLPITETERFELLKDGVLALDKLPANIQVVLCDAYSRIYR